MDQPKGGICTAANVITSFWCIWCPSIAVFVLRKTIQLYEPDLINSEIISRSFYVDDLLMSFQTKDEMERTLFSVKKLLQRGGFNLTKFLCNDDDIMKQVDKADRSKESRLPTKLTNVLGVKWNVDVDQFYFVVNVEPQTKVTKRTMLKVISSIYDPLTLISPSILMGRILLQQVTRLKLGWDHNVPKDILQRWYTWLKVLEQLKIHCHLIKSVSSVVTYQLHHFSDASQIGYGNVSYLRMENQDGTVTVSMLYSKARVSPIKPVTIPRLELLATALSVKIDARLKQEWNVKLEESVFWTDSEIVLAYICDTSKRYHTFVANKISQIRSHSVSAQWHHIPGYENPSDIASRGATPMKLKLSKWFTGPDILFQGLKDWPRGHKELVSSKDPEFKQKPPRCFMQPVPWFKLNQSHTWIN